MSAHFSIKVDPVRNLVRIEMSGLFAPADIADFLEARRRAHERLRCPPNAHLTLNDVRGMKIQHQEQVADFQAMLADPDYRSRRLAFVAAPTLARAQLARAVAGRSDTRLFDDPAEAEAWLLAAEEEPALRRAANG